MDESYYAALIDESNKPSSDAPIHLSLVLSRNKTNKSVNLGVAAKVPRKRLDCEDKVQYTIKYFSFLDDARMFSNLDALLTQLSPLAVVHLGCTESAEVSRKQNYRRISFYQHYMCMVCLSYDMMYDCTKMCLFVLD